LEIPTEALTTLAINGLAIGSLYTLLLLLAFRTFGRAGAIILTLLALAGWSALFLADPSQRFRDAPASLRLAVLPLVVAVSVVPSLAIHRVRVRHGASCYVRQAVHGLAGFYLAILGSLIIGLVVLLAGKSGGW
jgi:hypothetical protein